MQAKTPGCKCTALFCLPVIVGRGGMQGGEFGTLCEVCCMSNVGLWTSFPRF